MSVRQVPLVCPGHSRPVVFLEYTRMTADGFFIVSACKDGKPMLRDGVTGDWVGTFLGHKGAVWGAAIDRMGLRVATGSADFSAKLWDAITGDLIRTFEHPHIVRTTAFSEDGTKLLTGCQDKCLRVFDLENLDAPPIVLKGHEKMLRAAIFGVDSNQVLSTADQTTISVWDVSKAQIVQQLAVTEEKTVTIPQNPGLVTSIEMSHDKTRITSSIGHFVQIWDAQELRLIKTLDVGADISSASLHPNNDRVVVGGPDFRVRVHQFEDGEEVDVLKGHFGPVHCVRYAPDGESFSSGAEDGTIRIWQTDPKAKLKQQAEEATKAVPSPEAAVDADTTDGLVGGVEQVSLG